MAWILKRSSSVKLMDGTYIKLGRGEILPDNAVITDNIHLWCDYRSDDNVKKIIPVESVKDYKDHQSTIKKEKFAKLKANINKA
jgi:hypothetical protein